MGLIARHSLLQLLLQSSTRTLSLTGGVLRGAQGSAEFALREKFARTMPRKGGGAVSGRVEHGHRLIELRTLEPASGDHITERSALPRPRGAGPSGGES